MTTTIRHAGTALVFSALTSSSCIPLGLIGGDAAADGGAGGSFTTGAGNTIANTVGCTVSADAASSGQGGAQPSSGSGANPSNECLDPKPGDACYGLACSGSKPTGVCHGRVCGPDGLGGTCGKCPAGTTCSADGQCVGCTPDCSGKQCGDDRCGGSCGTCAQGKTCSVGECIDFAFQDKNELWSAYYVNEFRTKAVTYDGNKNLGLKGYPRPQSCTTNPELNKPQTPVRLNREMVLNARRSAQHIVAFTLSDPKYNLCQHYDPVDKVGALGDRIGGYLGSQGCQNIWCGFVSANSAPITGDPGHCECMLYGETDWGIGSFDSGKGPGIQVQDPATDSMYLPVIIENEALTTNSHQVKVYVPAQGYGGWTALGKIVEVQLSEDPCFAGASWQKYDPNLTFQLSPGDGRKVLYGRVKDDLGRTAVSWDSIFVGAEPKTVDSLEESIARIRKVRIPPLEKDGYDSFQYSTGFGLEMESQYLSWFATQNVENDPTATGGKAVWGTPQGYTGGTNFAPMEGDIYVRVKTKNNQGTQPIAWASWREDTGGIVGGRAILASDITAPNQWQWIRVPFTHVWGYSLIYFEFNTGGQNTLFDRFDVFSKPVPLARTREGGGMTIDFDDRNYRGIEIQIRYVNSKTGAWEDGPRINPYCATCSGSTSSVDSCAEGFQDCNGNPADGCETDLRVSALHCGKCGNSCGMSSKPGEVHQCAAGSCVQNSVLSRGHDGAYAIASDGSQLYWADWFGGNIESMPSGGGTVKKLATGQARPTSIAVDDTQIYWTTIEGGKVMRMPKNGGTPVEIAAGQAGPAVIALEGNNVYWGCYVGDGAIRTAPKTGGKVTTITTGVGGASALVVAGNHVYWTAGSQGQVARAPKTGGAVEVIAKGQAWPHGMVLDGSFAYWTNLKDGTINKAPLSPNASVTQLADGQQGPWTLALSGNTLYFTNYFGKEVMSLSTSGGKATPIAVDQPYPTGLTIHSGAVYWTTMTGGGATFFDYRNGTIVKAAAK